MRRTLPWILFLACLFFHVRGSEAHKPITSKYTYTEDVFPILSARCGRCHVSGGVAPMSLLSYKEAIPWAESMRVELTADHMPPWYVENDTHRLSPRELDILLTWAAGGTPEGPSRRLPAFTPRTIWKLGKPDLLLRMAVPFTLGPEKMEDIHDVLLGTSGESDRWIRALDVVPGTAAVVRSATVYTKWNSSENVLAVWLPGDDPFVVPSETGLRWQAGSELHLRIRYRKTWTYDGKTVTDQTNVGLYFLNQAPPHEIRSWTPAPESPTLGRAVRAVALRLDGGAVDKVVEVVATRPDGSRISLIKLLSHPDWNRRYLLARPTSLPAGTQIVANGAPDVRVFLDIIED